jgi:hypothetical protein
MSARIKTSKVKVTISIKNAGTLIRAFLGAVFDKSRI